MTAVQPAMRAMAWWIALSGILLGCAHRGPAARPEEVPIRTESPPTQPRTESPQIEARTESPQLEARTEMPITEEIPKAPRMSAPGITPFAPAPLRARWAITRPISDDLDGPLYGAAARGSLYMAACHESEVLVEKVSARGAIAWSTRIPGPCARIFDGGVRPIAATADGVVLALPAVVGRLGVRVLWLDPTGKIAWEREIHGGMRDLDVAATRGRMAICFHDQTPTSFDGQPNPTAHGDRIALELDDRGTRLGAYTAPATRCTYDEEHHLWMSDRGGARRVTGAYRSVVFPPSNHGYGATPFEMGWVVQEENSLVFVDHDGTRLWRIEWPTEDHACLIQPTPIMATAQRLLTGVYFFCTLRGATTHFGDLAIRSKPGNDLVRRMILLDIDTTTLRTRAQYELEHPPENMHELMQYVASPAGLFAYGRFRGPLGLGSKIVSNPPIHEFSRPRCTGGGHEITYPEWSAVVSFPVR